MDTEKLDHPARNDNRRYDYRGCGFLERPEYPVICEWIDEGSKVIDLGCGNGSLMKHLLDRKKVRVLGIEREESGVEFCRRNGLQANLGAIDQKETYLSYREDEFDVAVCNVTLQMVLYPEVLVADMARIARRQILSFPHFGHVLNRLDHALTGRMPRPQLYGYRWYNTGHIHQLGLRDFRDFCGVMGLRVLREAHLGRPLFLSSLLPNLFSRTGVFLCEKTPRK